MFAKKMKRGRHAIRLFRGRDVFAWVLLRLRRIGSEDSEACMYQKGGEVGGQLIIRHGKQAGATRRCRKWVVIRGGRQAFLLCE